MRHPTAPFSAATFGLMPRHDCSVASDDDCALDRDAVPVEDFVVLRPPVVHVDERRRDITVTGVRVVGRQLLVLLGRRGILRHDRFVETRACNASARRARGRVPSASGTGRRTFRFRSATRTRGTERPATPHCPCRRATPRDAAGRSDAASTPSWRRAAAGRDIVRPTDAVELGWVDWACGATGRRTAAARNAITRRRGIRPPDRGVFGLILSRRAELVMTGR